MKKNLLSFFTALILGLFYDLFFYGKEIGISYPVYLIFVLSIFVIIFKDRIKELPRLVVFVPIILLSTTFALFSNNVLLGLNMIVIPLLSIFAFSFLLSNSNYKWYNFKDIFSQFFNNDTQDNLLKPIQSPIRIIKDKVGSYSDEDSNDGKIKKIFIGVAISLPLLIFVISLLSSADSNFSDSINSIPNFLSSLIDIDVAPHVFLVLFVAFIFSALFGIFINSMKKKELIEHKSSEVIKKKQDSIIVSTILIMINAVYVLFVLIQFSYLFGDDNKVLTTPDLSYAEYAIKGFNELVIVAMINFSLLLFSIYYTEIKTKSSQKVFSTLLTVLSFNTLVILYSGYSRLHLYQEAYGYSQRRITVYIFMFSLFVLVVQTLWKVYKPKTMLFRNIIISSFTIYMAVNFINVDYIIAKYNVDRYFEIGKIDIDYFKELSNDAVPQLKRLSESKERYVREGAEEMISNRKEKLESTDYWQSYKFTDSHVLNN